MYLNTNQGVTNWGWSYKQYSLQQGFTHHLVLLLLSLVMVLCFSVAVVSLSWLAPSQEGWLRLVSHSQTPGVSCKDQEYVHRIENDTSPVTNLIPISHPVANLIPISPSCQPHSYTTPSCQPYSHITPSCQPHSYTTPSCQPHSHTTPSCQPHSHTTSSLITFS